MASFPETYNDLFPLRFETEGGFLKVDSSAEGTKPGSINPCKTLSVTP